MHPALATRLTGDKPYYMTGGLIPHLTKKGHFWKSSPPAIHMAVVKYRLYIDPFQSANLGTVEQIDCGWTAPLPRRSQYDSATGLHQSLSARNREYWVQKDGTTAKESGIIGRGEQLRSASHPTASSSCRLRNASNTLEYASLLDNPTARVHSDPAQP